MSEEDERTTYCPFKNSVAPNNRCTSDCQLYDLDNDCCTFKSIMKLLKK